MISRSIVAFKSIAYSPIFLLFISCFLFYTATAQTPVDTTFKPGGRLWGSSFGDYYYKAHSDSMSRIGGFNQYTGVPKGRNAFYIRRVYLGYNYDISKKFTAELLVAGEENTIAADGTPNGDLLTDNKLGFFIKLANIRWKNIWRGTDLLIGELYTPAFSLLTEQVWGYRPIERTIADAFRTPAYDLGISLRGKFDPQTENFGYDIMVGNGTQSRPENDKFKWLYGDVYAKFLDKKLVFDLYADYERLNWAPGFHHTRNMVKGFAAYTTPAFTLGVEAFINHGQQDVVGTASTRNDTLNSNAKGLSVFARGSIIKDKLGYFARTDFFNPDVNYNDAFYPSYKGLSTYYNPDYKQRLMTAGLDFTPAKNVHFMPNITYTGYLAQRAGLTGIAQKDYDLVYRITFYYIYNR